MAGLDDSLLERTGIWMKLRSEKLIEVGDATELSKAA
jgi:hypothetical protein